MSDINTAAISGRLTRDPELRHTPSGTAVCNLGVAVSKSRKTDDGYTEETSFIDVVVWGSKNGTSDGLAGLVNRKFRVGDSIVVQGELKQSSWEQEGQKRSKVEIVAREITGEAMYRKDEDVKPKKDGDDAPAATTTTTATAPAAGGSDDDIPF